jgi:hypothetical protein
MKKEYKRNWHLFVEPSKKEIRDAHGQALFEIILFELKGKFPCTVHSIDFVEISEASGYVKVIISE